MTLHSYSIIQCSEIIKLVFSINLLPFFIKIYEVYSGVRSLYMVYFLY